MRSTLAFMLLLGAHGATQAYTLHPATVHQLGTYQGEVDTVAIGDIDGDGRNDLAFATSEWNAEDNRLFVLLQRPDGTLAEAIELPIPAGEASRLFIHDLDGDGRGEVIAGHTNVYEGQSGGITIARWQDGQLVASAHGTADDVGTSHLAILDVDRDGHPDLLAQGHRPTYSDGRGLVYFGDGHGGVDRVEQIVAPAFQAPQDMVAADLDGDGHRDLVVRSRIGFEDYIDILYNDGSGDLAPAVTFKLDPDGPADGGGYGIAIGDFNDDGRNDIVTKSHQNYYDFMAVLLQGASGTFTATTPLQRSGAPDATHATDLNGDGRDDLVTMSGSGLAIWFQGENGLGRETQFAPATYRTHPSMFGVATGDIDSDGCRDVVVAHGPEGYLLYRGKCTSVTDDFDGDGASDVLWRHASNGANAIWLGADGEDPLDIRAVRNTDWEIVATGDFDGDSVADLFWRNRDTGANAIWPSAAPGSTAVKGVTRTEWRVVGAGDFDGDRRDDLFWRNEATGANAVWPSGHPGEVATQGVRNLAWRVVGVGDFDGDRQADVLWRNASDGRNVIWRSGDFDDQQAVGRVASAEWTVAGIGDFDADGVDDILWRNTATGANAIWRRADARSRLPVTNVSNLEWQVAATGDYDADGAADILWRNTRTGANVAWRSAAYAEQLAVDRVRDLDWEVVPRR